MDAIGVMCPNLVRSQLFAVKTFVPSGKVLCSRIVQLIIEKTNVLSGMMDVTLVKYLILIILDGGAQKEFARLKNTSLPIVEFQEIQDPHLSKKFLTLVKT